MKKTHIPIRYMALAVLILLVSAALCGCAGRPDKMAQYGQEQFLAQDYEEFLSLLGDVCGFSDLTADWTFSYLDDFSYKKDEDLLNLTCTLDALYSDEIDAFYADNSTKRSTQKAYGQELAGRLAPVKEFRKEYTYHMEDGGTIVVDVHVPMGSAVPLVVKSSAGNKYKYSTSGGYIDVSVNGDILFMEKQEGYVSSSGNHTDSGTPGKDAYTCESCDRPFSDRSNKNYIAHTNMCENCYKNYCFMVGKTPKNYSKD